MRIQPAFIQSPRQNCIQAQQKRNYATAVVSYPSRQVQLHLRASFRGNDHSSEAFDLNKLLSVMDKQGTVSLPVNSETFMDAYKQIERQIREKYDAKIAAVKDGFFFSGKAERQEIRSQKEAALKLARTFQRIFEEREEEAIRAREKLLDVARMLNMSKDMLVRYETAQIASRSRLQSIERKKLIADKVGFCKIGGYVPEKTRLMTTFIDRIENEAAGKRMDEPVPNAILFHGPTGCGKTTLVNSLVDETGCKALEINYSGTAQEKAQQLYNALRGCEVEDEFGEIEVKQGILEKAQKRFKNTGKRTIIVIDEFDRFFDDKGSKAFTNEMKDILENCSRDYHVTFLLTTNNPNRIPYELRNAHRISQIYPIDPPDKSNATAVIEHYLEGVDVDNLDYDKIWTRLMKHAPSERYSNSHIETICDIAITEVKSETKPLSTNDFITAIDNYDNSSNDANLLRLTKKYLDSYEEDKRNIG